MIFYVFWWYDDDVDLTITGVDTDLQGCAKGSNDPEYTLRAVCRATPTNITESVYERTCEGTPCEVACDSGDHVTDCWTTCKL